MPLISIDVTEITHERWRHIECFSQKSTDPVNQMQHNNIQYTHPTVTITQPFQSANPLPQYIPMQQDTFINTLASIPESMKPFIGSDHSYTPEEYL